MAEACTDANYLEILGLIKAAQQGEEAAKTDLVDRHWRLVRSLVQRFTGRGWEVEDLCQIGVIGLLKAIDNFDLSFNNKFSTYAVPMIIGEIKRTLRDDHEIRVSRRLREIANKAWWQQEELTKSLAREPSINELAQALEISAAELTEALDACRRPASLEMVITNTGEDFTLADTIAGTELDEVWLTKIELKQALETLDPRLAYIIMARFFYEKTQAEIAAALKISQVQVCRLEKQALNCCKEYLSEQYQTS